MFPILTFSCSLFNTNSNRYAVLFEIDDSPVSTEEFHYSFSKNISSDSSITRKDVDDYLNLYINFKLKVKEAMTRGLDTTSSFKSEYGKYKDQLTESYLRDDSIIDVLVMEAYERMQNEVDVSHILIRINDLHNPTDTLKAYRKIEDVYQSLNSGADFEKTAAAYSEDPSVKMNRGHLGYFTALQMVYPFETMAYNTPVNQFSRPFKTRFGYHIVKVHDIRPARGKVQVAHIMLRFTANMTSMDSIKASQDIYSLYDSLNLGGDWDILCKRYSQDINSKNSGGVLQPFETGRVIPSFGEAAFSLAAPGDISSPVMTPYGWHIIRLLNISPIGSFDELQDDLTERVKRDSRSELTHTFLIDKLKRENNFLMDESVKKECLIMGDSSLLTGKWFFDSTAIIVNETLFLIKDQPYMAGEFLRYVENMQSGSAHVSAAMYMNELMNNYVDEKLIEYQKAHLEEKYFDYKMLSREYREGILLFDLMDMEVWSKAMTDTLGLKTFFMEHRDHYTWNERLDGMIFSSSGNEGLDLIRDLLGQSYYAISGKVLAFEMKEKGFLNDSIRMQVENLVRYASSDSSLYIQVVCNGDIMKAFLDYVHSMNWSTDKFQAQDTTGETLKLTVVTSSKKALENLINQNSTLNLQVESGYYEKGDHEIIDLVDWHPGIFDLSIEDVEYLVYVERIIPVSLKTFNDVRGQVISDYQHDLENRWVEELKDKYSIVIHKNALSKIYKEFKAY